MITSPLILVIDQGTTSTRSLVFDNSFSIVASAQEEFQQHFPSSGWVEHLPADLWESTVSTTRSAIEQIDEKASDIVGIGITNQRETVVIWDLETGQPIHNAIVWQDRRTADYCESLRKDGLEDLVTSKTGLLLDPYFSATKVKWILDNVEGAKQKAKNGKLAFGTVDSWIIWNMTEGANHVTDVTNASRTMLFNIHEGCWDQELLDLFGIPLAMLPEVKDCATEFGITRKNLFGDISLPISGVAGDQQAATLGQACFQPGMFKSTYGTGCFALLNTGNSPVKSSNRLLTTIAYQLNGAPTYALEGSIFVAGAAVQWLRDGLGIITDAASTESLAKDADNEQNVYLVPAFTGMGAPWWDANARGAIFGLTRGTGPKELALATLESVCYQTLDLLNAMHSDWKPPQETILRVDGGMVANNWVMQRLADILNAPVDRPVILETTALGAAWLTGHQHNVWPDMEGFANSWRLDQKFSPKMPTVIREKKISGWQQAVQRTLTS